MKPLRLIAASDVVALATDAAALALPPGAYGVLPDWWSSREAPPELELEIWAPAALALTAAVLYGATTHPLVYADQTVTFSAATNLMTKATHNLKTGDGPFAFATVGGTQPPELVAGTGYYFIRVDANTGKLATTRANALAGTFIDLTADGTGTTTISDTPTTERVYWQTHDGLLGLAGDGAISLDVQVGYRKRIPHSPRVIAYALVGTISAGTLSALLVPVMDAA
jgi:hypothetical protein